ncbi:D-alanyl-D-alanine carboxypeptidase [Patescibacteria group bacterium]|nr:D-alanyl-D-alanine carboxypeptidase [Patescibacteria group bacterium]
MLTNLLSLYIASSIQTHLDTNLNTNSNIPTSSVKAASFDLIQLSKDSPPPLKNPKMVAPIVDAGSAMVIDLKSGSILLEKSIHQRRKIASITKLMTALIILEENNFDEIVTVSNNSAATGGSTMYLRKGEEIELINLLNGLIINSANDAAVALAEHNAGDVNTFTEKMNKKALSLGLVNTHFANPSGLDHNENYSSAYDLAKLSRYVYQKQFVKEVAKVQEMQVKSTDGKLVHKLNSTNLLLGDENYHIKGLKTGKTDGAGECLIAIAENEQGAEILTVILGSSARFRESKILIDWVFRAYTWKN